MDLQKANESISVILNTFVLLNAAKFTIFDDFSATLEHWSLESIMISNSKPLATERASFPSLREHTSEVDMKYMTFSMKTI